MINVPLVKFSANFIKSIGFLKQIASSDSSLNVSARSRQSQKAHERRKSVDKDKAEKESEHGKQRAFALVKI